VKRSSAILLAAAAIVLAACSLTRVAYNNAGFVLTHMVDDYFDLSGSQEDWVRERLGRVLAWHRASELPEYDRFLRETLARTERTFTEEDARWAYASLRTYYLRLVEQLIPDAADFLLQLEGEQARHFEKRFHEESDKIAREQAKPDRGERQARRAKRLVENFESYTGKLSPEQRLLITTRASATPDTTLFRLEDRRERQRQLAELVRTKPPKLQMEAGLRRILVDTASWRDPAYVAALKLREERFFEMVAAVAATLTPEQRASVQSKLRSYQREVSSLLALR
jgi:hypothetical protein